MSADPSARRAIVGAATTLTEFPLNADWFRDAPRDLEIGDAVAPDLLDSAELQAAYTERALATLGGHAGRRGIHGPFQGISIASPDHAIREVVARRFIESIRFAATFGATHMVIHSPFMGWINPSLFSGKGSNIDTQIANIQRTLEPVIPVAVEHGVILMIENIRDLNIFPLLDTMRAIDHPHVRLSLDVGHAQLHVPVGGMTPDQYVREAGDLLGHIHLQDVDGEADRHWAPGDGIVNFRALFAALREVPNDPRLIIELKDKADIQRGAAHLASLGLTA
ncbi:MAG: sugar phosphate isomerase/epimerase family protein [Thermomicrobiales bacterium]